MAWKSDTTMGPATTARGVDKARAFVDEVVRKGAQILTGRAHPS
jgi:acyl-CoA reductase-like NAD-dependent aldehyde dehydrogenase